MGVVVVGQEVSWQFTAATTGLLTLPDGTTTALTASGSGSAWTVAYTPVQAGRHTLVWSTGTAKRGDVLDVWPAQPGYLISVDDAARAVSAGGTLTQALRDELPLHIAAATMVIEDLTGPLVPATRTHTGHGGRAAVLLPAVGVSVQAVTVDGAPVEHDVDEAAGVVYATSGTFRQGRSNVVVSYTVGSTGPVPAAARLACIEQVKFLWQVQRQGATRDDLGYTPSGFAVPRMVEQLCASVPSHEAPAGFA